MLLNTKFSKYFKMSLAISSFWAANSFYYNYRAIIATLEGTVSDKGIMILAVLDLL